ncbi:MAG: SusC/RagA family TonB-linked outer membrane protein, partial [Alphaproteobacteria bacterium]|nr:SusC/RagA family TonB-linked outer membrane protein [Alphaproteobacteria bacterium]
MLKKLQVFALCLLALFNVAMAQNETTGKVVDEATKAPLAGATIKEIGTNSSTSTDDNGNFSIKLKNPKAFLLISYTGYGNKQIRADVLSKNNTITLNQDKENLEGVVVTALGIKKEKKSLGFSVSSVNSKDIDQNPQVDLGRALSGKAPGLNILGTSGLSGSGTNINIRGVASITQGSQPLFIVDGVPFDGGTNTATSGGGASGNSNFTYGNNNTSRFFDLDPNNIQSVEVLKSLAATTLYGELGANGVILITTKTGAHNNPRKKSEITVSYTYNVNEVANLPVYNNEWGGGFDLSVGLAFYSNWGGRFTNPPSLVNHPYNTPALAAAFPQFQGKQYELKFYDGVKGFFRKGGSQTTSINLSGGTKDATYTANYSYLDEDGFIVGNGTLRHNFGFGGSAKLSNRFSFNGTVNFVKSRVKSPPTSTSFGSGATNSSVFGDVLYTPTGVDLVGLPWENPITKGSIYYRPANDIQNPWWTVYNAFTENQTDRVYGNAAIKLDATKWLNISYRIGFDNYNENTLYAQNKGGIDGNPLGYYRTLSRENQIWDHTLFAQFKKDWEDGIGVTADLGYNLRQTSYFQQGQYSVEQLVYGLLDHTNFVTHSNESEDGSDLDRKFNAVSLGYFGTATVNYKDFIYVSAGGRYSTTSRLETKNSSIFYPNASVSFILTEAVEALQNLKGLNYLKFRFGYGTSAKFPDYEYVTRNALNIQTRSFVTRTGTVINTNAPSTFLANSNLKPELQSDIEFGIDGRFWDNRINVELSLYNKKSTDQILRQSLDPSTGFTSTLINAGNLDNKGIEVAFGINLVRTKDWNWKLDFLYSLNQS